MVLEHNGLIFIEITKNAIIYYYVGITTNPDHFTGLFSYPLKTSENQRFSDVFKGYKRDQWHEVDYEETL